MGNLSLSCDTQKPKVIYVSACQEVVIIRVLRAGEMDNGQIDKHWASRIVKQVEDTQSSTVAYLRHILFSVPEDNQRAIQKPNRQLGSVRDVISSLFILHLL